MNEVGLVGYKSPPTQSRFRPGRSGNLHGRPKRTPTLKSDLEDELNGNVTVREDGKQQTITKRQAIVKALVRAAIDGDIRAANAIATFVKSSNPAESFSKEDSIDDQDIANRFVDREIKRRIAAGELQLASSDAKKDNKT